MRWGATPELCNTGVWAPIFLPEGNSLCVQEADRGGILCFTSENKGKILSQPKHFWDMNTTQLHVHGVTQPTEQFNLSGTLTQNQRLGIGQDRESKYSLDVKSS